MKQKNQYKLLILFVLILTTQVFALKVPKLKSRVMDYSHLLTSYETTKLEEKLYNFETQTSNQLVVLILPSLKGESIESYSMKVAEQWKLGQKGRDNGAILLISVKDKKVRIEVGYGLEGALTDLIAASIIRNEISHYFRQGQYYKGIDAGISSMMLATRNEYKAIPQQRKRSKKQQSSSFGSLIIFIIFIFLSLGGRGGRRGRGNGLLWFLIGSSMFRGGGSSGGFGGGGGFSGFSGGGGGGFGGGGASGGW